MIIIMKPNASDEAVQKVTHIIESKGLQVHLSKGSQVTIVGVVGDKTRLLGSIEPLVNGGAQAPFQQYRKSGFAGFF